MKTKMITVYQFSELSQKTQQKVLDKFRETSDSYWIYSEAQQTVKAFEKYFPTDSRGKNSWLECNVNANDEILELIGLRLRTYLLNNFEYILYKNKKFYSKNKSRTSKILKEPNNCSLTGYCYDCNMLEPIYHFICGFKYRDYNFDELMKECYQNLKTALEKEEEYMYSDEYIIENIECNGYEFMECGTII